MFECHAITRCCVLLVNTKAYVHSCIHTYYIYFHHQPLGTINPPPHFPSFLAQETMTEKGICSTALSLSACLRFLARILSLSSYNTQCLSNVFFRWLTVSWVLDFTETSLSAFAIDTEKKIKCQASLSLKGRGENMMMILCDIIIFSYRKDPGEWLLVFLHWLD